MGMLLTTVSLVSLTVGPNARSQTMAPTSTRGAGKNNLEEVVVTARRRSEAAQKVPISITTLSARTLERHTILQSNDLQYHVPNLKIGFGSVFTESPTFNVRGADQSLNTEPSTTIYVNEVPQSTRGIANAIYDLQNIAILKGPQGVAFGRNSVGGAVLFTPQRPTNALSGFLQQQVGNYGFTETTGALNIPVVDDKVLFRIAGDYANRDGLLKNIGGPDAQNENHGSFRASLTLKPVDWFSNFTSVDGYRADEIPEVAKPVAATGCISNQGPIVALQQSLIPCLYANSPVLAPLAPFIGLSSPFVTPPVHGGTFPGSYTTAEALPNGSVDDPYPTKSTVNVIGLSNTSTVDIESWLNFKNIFGFRHESSDSFNNSSGLPSQNLITHFIDHVDQLTEEAQFQGKVLNESLSYLVGGFYLHNNQKDPVATTDLLGDLTPANRAALYYLTTPCLASPGGCPIGTSPGLKPTFSEQPFTITNASYAVYSQIKWQPFKSFGEGRDWLTALNINAGYRYTWDHYVGNAVSLNSLNGVTFPGGQSLSPPFPAQSPAFYCDYLDVYGNILPGSKAGSINKASCTNHSTGEFDEPSYQIGFDYQLAPQVLVFYSHSHSFKAGGLNPYNSLPSLNTFAPEQVTADEIGIKSGGRLAGNPFRFNVSVYQNEYGNIQNELVAFIAGQSQAATIDVPSATLRGMDLEFEYRPIAWLDLNGFASWEEGRYDSSVDLVGTAPIDPVACPQHFLCTNGVAFVGISKWTADISATVQLPVSAPIGAVSLTGDYYYRTSVYGFLQPLVVNGPGDPYNKVGGFGVANMRLDWTGMFGSRFDGSLFVNNLLDQRRAVFSTDNLGSLGYASQNYENPRLYGALLRYHF
jgi:iron complex outermembrane receptor protein